MRFPSRVPLLIALASFPAMISSASLPSVGVAADNVLSAGDATFAQKVASSKRTYTIVDLGAGTLGAGSHATAINERGQVIGISATANGEPRATLWQDGEVTDLGTLGGPTSQPADINRSGHVVGISTTPSGSQHAVLWQDGTVIDLGTLGGSVSLPYDINDRDQIAGTSSTATGEFRAVLWQNGTVTDLGVPDGRAFRINDRGHVLVGSGTLSSESRAFLWKDGVTTELGTLGGSGTTPFDMNDRGQVVGYSITATGENHAFLWQDGAMTDLGTLGGSSSYAIVINNRGMVLGTSSTATGEEHGFIWQDGSMTDLGLLYPKDVNDHGVVVGNAFIGAQALLWHAGAVTELGTLGGSGSFAYDMNSHGQIAGYSYTENLEGHACVWRKGVTPGGFSAPAVSHKEPVATDGSGFQVHISSPPGVVPIEFEVRGLSEVPRRISVFDVQGRRVHQWESFAGRDGRESWNGRRADGTPVASGLYFVRLEVGGQNFIRKIILAR
jgi:probable HAF family extracellular repeat protein